MAEEFDVDSNRQPAPGYAHSQNIVRRIVRRFKPAVSFPPGTHFPESFPSSNHLPMVARRETESRAFTDQELSGTSGTSNTPNHLTREVKSYLSKHDIR